jgi:hypothetical protein
MLRFSTAAYPSAARSFMSRLIMSREAQRVRSASSGLNAADRLRRTLLRHPASAHGMQGSSDDEQVVVECLSSQDPNVPFEEDWTADKGSFSPVKRLLAAKTPSTGIGWKLSFASVPCPRASLLRATRPRPQH